MKIWFYEKVQVQSTFHLLVLVPKPELRPGVSRFLSVANSQLLSDIPSTITSWWVSDSRSVTSDSLRPHGLYSLRNSPGQNTGVGSLSLLQGIFPTQGMNPGLLHCRQIPYQLKHWKSPRILEWVPYPFFRGSSWPRKLTGVSCITSGFFTSWATREAITSIKWCNHLYNDLSELLSCFFFFFKPMTFTPVHVKGLS